MRLTFDHVDVRLEGSLIVDDVSFDVGPGEIVGLVGPNGCGKSTLLRTAYRVQKPSRGHVALDDLDIWGTSVRQVARRVGVVAQLATPDFPLTVAEVVGLGRAAHKGLLQPDDAHDAEIVHASLARTGMEHQADASFGHLSGGERQRVLIAQALAGEPRVLLLDEPTNHLDLKHQVSLMHLLREIGTTTLVALHDLGLASRFCDRMVVLDRGRVHARGTPGDVVTPSLLSEVYEVDALVLDHPVDGSPMVVLR